MRQVRAVALGAHASRAVALDFRQAAAKRRDAVARKAAVGLDLGLARAADADAAAATRRRGARGASTAAHAGQVVLELRELDLQLALGRVRVLGEDVEDTGGTAHPGPISNRGLLPRESAEKYGN